MQWYYGIGNEVGGPVEDDGLLGLVRSGEVRADTLVWASYLGNWTPAVQIDGLFASAGVAMNPGQSERKARRGAETQAAVRREEPVLAGMGAEASRGEQVRSEAGGEFSKVAARRESGPPAVETPVVVPVQEQVAPRVETEELGLTAVPPPGAATELNTAGVPLNPAGQGIAPPGGGQPEPGEKPGDFDDLGTGAEDTARSLAETFRAAPVVGVGAGEAPGVGVADSEFQFAPSAHTPTESEAGWKKWALPAVAAVVLLAGGAALADKFVLGGSLFGFGSRPTGPNRFFPEGPRYAAKLEVRDLLMNPLVTQKLDQGGGMHMVDQMMQSAVGLRPYDIQDVRFVGTDLAGSETSRFICMVTTTKKIPEDLVVEKLFAESQTEKIGGRKVYELPMSDLAACIAEDNTFLLGGRDELEEVLTRTEEPEFSPRELEMIGAVSQEGGFFSLSIDCEMMESLEDLRSGIPGGVPEDFFSSDELKLAETMSLEANLADGLEITYRINFETEEAAKAAFEQTEEQFGGTGGEGAGMVAKFKEQLPEGAEGVMGMGFECTIEGKSVVVTSSIPLALIEQMVGQGVGAAAGGGGQF